VDVEAVEMQPGRIGLAAHIYTTLQCHHVALGSGIPRGLMDPYHHLADGLERHQRPARVRVLGRRDPAELEGNLCAIVDADALSARIGLAVRTVAAVDTGACVGGATTRAAAATATASRARAHGLAVADRAALAPAVDQIAGVDGGASTRATSRTRADGLAVADATRLAPAVGQIAGVDGGASTRATSRARAHGLAVADRAALAPAVGQAARIRRGRALSLAVDDRADTTLTVEKTAGIRDSAPSRTG